MVCLLSAGGLLAQGQETTVLQQLQVKKNSVLAVVGDLTASRSTT